MAGPNTTLSLLLAIFFVFVYEFGLVSACEGACITGITNVFNGNYTIPVQLTILSLADQINSQLLPDNPPSAGYLDPLTIAYNDAAYASMSHAIFPSFFHGKCQDPVTGINPRGCPNPDCPVVCGTPGSMVHFYSRLRYIAFNTTWHLLHELARPGSSVFAEIQSNVEELRNGVTRRRRRSDLDSAPPLLGDSRVYALVSRSEPSAHASRFNPPSDETFPASSKSSVAYKRFLFPDLAAAYPRYLGRFAATARVRDAAKAKRDNYVRDTLSTIFSDIRFIMEKICGGDGDGTTNGLPYCSWERSMKEYILTFP